MHGPEKKRAILIPFLLYCAGKRGILIEYVYTTFVLFGILNLHIRAAYCNIPRESN